MPDEQQQPTGDDNAQKPNETRADEVAGQTAQQPATGELGDAGKQAIDRMKAERDDATRRAKALERELTLAKQAGMNESEKALNEAENKGRAAARTEFGQRLARTEFDALAGRRNADVNTAQVLEYVDLSKFVTEDGEPNLKAIAAAVDRLVPAAAGGTPDYDGGARTSAPPAAGMNQLIRKAAGRT